MRIPTLLLLMCMLFLQFQVHAADPPPPPGMVSTVPGAELWRKVRQRDGKSTDGISQVKGVDAGILINTQGDRWARFRINKLSPYGSIALAVVFLVIVLFFVLRGKIGIDGGLSGRMVHRFSDYERIVHWTLAIVFIFLAITGLILLLGRPLLIPLLGKEAFSLLASAGKEGHNLFGPIFLISLLMMLFSFVRRNIYEKGDLTWLLKGGGFIGEGHVSGGFFNMGEKTWYWIVILIGLLISISGLVLVMPNFGQSRIIMEISHVLHVLGAVVLIAVSIGHMYLGSFGTEGTAEGMKTGYVDINWVEAHHDRWAKECHEKNLVISAEEYARILGKKAESGELLATEQEQGK
ncbi:MAG: formate dehydrogenase subunit gamma [Gammaproteobacteria bacterium]|nr:formate dehydrogenase subunit gamma [Gammaproteobacteria bacterium]